MNLGEKIIGLRKENGLTQEELASKLNVSRQTISKWELSQSNPDLNYIVKLSELFEVTTDYLIKDEILHNDTEITSSDEVTDNNILLNNDTVSDNVSPPEISKSSLGGRQISGIILASLGGLCIILSLILLGINHDLTFLIMGVGIVVTVTGFELLMIKKNVLIKILWTLWCIICSPAIIFLLKTPFPPLGLTSGSIMYCISLITLIPLIYATITVKRKSKHLNN